MKKQCPIAAAVLLAASSLTAQNIDTVSLSTGYAQQVWYQLEAGNRLSAAKNEWDLAFELSGFGTSVLVNTVAGAQLWAHPTADTSDWATLDTTGLSTWTPLYNSDTSWTWGAFSNAANTTDPFDQGWGQYNMVTHQIIGSRLFVVKGTDGSYKKIWIKNLISGTYNFEYADLDGNNAHTAALAKSAFGDKTFAYYSLQNHNSLDREPLQSDWDLLFTQYTAFIPTPYTVAGVLSHPQAEVAQAYPVANPLSHSDYSSFPFETAINTIGYDWKEFQGAWTLADSLAYFVKTAQGDIWRLVFTGFGGSGTGNFIFEKEKLLTNSLTETPESKGIFTLYPNPVSNGQAVQMVYDLPHFGSDAQVSVMANNGQLLHQQNLRLHQGFSQQSLYLPTLAAGQYWLHLYDGKQQLTQAIIIR